MEQPPCLKIPVNFEGTLQTETPVIWSKTLSHSILKILVLQINIAAYVLKMTSVISALKVHNQA